MSVAGAAGEAVRVSNHSTETQTGTRVVHVFLTRGLVAIAWAAVFAGASDSLTFGVGVLLVLYPLIDVVGSVIDARGQQGSARQLLAGA